MNRALKRILIGFLLLFVSIGRAAELTPILVSNGMDMLACDGVMRWIFTTPLQGKQVVATYLFGNLTTSPDAGADVFIWSPSYWNAYPPAYPGGPPPSSNWGSLGDLHSFGRPNASTGGGTNTPSRTAESYRSFQPDGITINDNVQLVYICYGGGTLELYAVIYVR